MVAYAYLTLQNSSSLLNNRESDCLGIFGVVGNQETEEGSQIAEEACLRGLKELSVNGYDSCGLATLNKEHESALVISKHA